MSSGTLYLNQLASQFKLFRHLSCLVIVFMLSVYGGFLDEIEYTHIWYCWTCWWSDSGMKQLQTLDCYCCGGDCRCCRYRQTASASTSHHSVPHAINSQHLSAEGRPAVGVDAIQHSSPAAATAATCWHLMHRHECWPLCTRRVRPDKNLLRLAHR